MENLELYKKNAKPPKWALKTIQAGRMKGNTDIKPQWRYQALTETFGLIGFGWKYEIKRTWIDDGANDEIIANAEILLYVKINDKWSEPVPGIGGASFVAKESKGLYTSDECYKMAVTDALSVACKMLGIASDIYLGKWDGSKYIDETPPPPPKKPTEKPKLMLGSDNYKKVFKALVDGYKMDDIKKKYEISKLVQDKLESDMEELIEIAAKNTIDGSK